MESFGKYLKEHREERGVSIEEIARVTKISPGQLSAIESDDFASLPPIAFVKGFVKAYSKHIGLNPDDTLMRLEQFLSDIEEEEEDSFIGEANVRKFRKASPDPRILVASIVIFFSILILIIILAVKSCGSVDTRSVSDEGAAMEIPLNGDIHMEVFPILAESSEPARTILPTVPPQAFRVGRTGPPVIITIEDVPGNDESEEQPGGGASGAKDH